jgi:predicted DNA-binding protein
MSHPVLVRVPDELFERLKEISDEESRSYANVMIVAFKEFLENREGKEKPD